MPKPNENKAISDKIAQVRQVVQAKVNGITNNDIALALHSFDLNVERTIQAFMEDGASEVLDDWVRPAVSGSKKNNKNKKKPAEPVPAPVASTPKETAPRVSPQSVEAKQDFVPAPSTVASAIKAEPRQINGHESSSTPSTALKQKFQEIRNAVASKEKELHAAGVTSVDISFLLDAINSLGSKVPAAKKLVAAVEPPVKTESVKNTPPVKPVKPVEKIEPRPAKSEEPTKQCAATSASTHVALGGLQMSSDALSSEQLEALQRSLQQQLAAKGIDESVLNELSRSDNTSVRRNRKPDPKKAAVKDKQGARSAILSV